MWAIKTRTAENTRSRDFASIKTFYAINRNNNSNNETCKQTPHDDGFRGALDGTRVIIFNRLSRRERNNGAVSALDTF